MIQIGKLNSGQHPRATPAVAAKGQHSEGYCNDVSAIPDEYTPTPETEPHQIAADQRAAVLKAMRHVGRRVEALSARVVLPVSVVARRLRELGYAVPDAPETCGRQGQIRNADLLDMIEKYLRRHGPALARDIGGALRRQSSQVGDRMNREPARFYVLRQTKGFMGRAARVWWLVGVPVPAAKEARRTG